MLEFYYGVSYQGKKFHYHHFFHEFRVTDSNEEEAIKQVRSLANSMVPILKEQWKEDEVTYRIKKIVPDTKPSYVSTLSNEELWEIFGQPTDGYYEHNLRSDAIIELIRRGELKGHPWEQRHLNPRKPFVLPYVNIKR